MISINRNIKDIIQTYLIDMTLKKETIEFDEELSNGKIEIEKFIQNIEITYIFKDCMEL